MSSNMAIFPLNENNVLNVNTILDKRIFCSPVLRFVQGLSEN